MGQPKTSDTALSEPFGEEPSNHPEGHTPVPVVGQHPSEHSPELRIEDIHGTFEGVEKLTSAWDAHFPCCGAAADAHFETGRYPCSQADRWPSW